MNSNPSKALKSSHSKLNVRTDAVKEEIQKMILSGEIKPGDAFPPERTLAESLKVSRNTIREAYNSLEALGIIKTVQGSGRYLVEEENLLNRVFETRQLVEKYTKNELVEARRILEVGIASLAASRATRVDKLALQENLRAMGVLIGPTGTISDCTRFNHLDYQFHLHLATISNNSILREMLNALQGMIYTTAMSINNTEQAVSEAYHWHNEILNAICNNDSAKAAYAMTQHLQFAGQLYNN